MLSWHRESTKGRGCWGLHMSCRGRGRAGISVPGRDRPVGARKPRYEVQARLDKADMAGLQS